ncbi:hypothetical protein UlMin_037598 [Ulmus minor]
MSQQEVSSNKGSDDDQHEHDMVMPGFRFHPTEEELVEFYLRRKVEGKRFNVELITFLDLYRYDPWELPALAAIGEKEWFFYVPRDRKYRNGDRPNRVTTSGYWKATGADRMIRTENFRSIGLKKTLVFYSGKAPKGIRTSWIMNEYRLPQHETERYQKAEISLCRVYKRAGVEDHPSLPRSLPSRASSSRSSSMANSSDKKQHNTIHNVMEKLQAFGGQPIQPQPQPPRIELESMNDTDGSSNNSDVSSTVLGLSQHKAYRVAMAAPIGTSLGQQQGASSMEDQEVVMFPPQQSKQACSLIPASCATLFSTGSSSTTSSANIDDLHRLVNYQQVFPISNSISHGGQHQQLHYYNDQQLQQFPPMPLQQSQQQPLMPTALNGLPNFLPTTFSDRLWEWNPFPEGSPNNPFK